MKWKDTRPDTSMKRTRTINKNYLVICRFRYNPKSMDYLGWVGEFGILSEINKVLEKKGKEKENDGIFLEENGKHRNSTGFTLFH